MEGIFKTVVHTHLKNAVGNPDIHYEATIWVDGIAARCIKIHSITEVENYVEECFPTLFMTAAMNTSEYRAVISRGHGNIFCKLVTFVNGRAKDTSTYQGIAHVQGDPNVEASTQMMGMADNITISVVTFELYTRAAWALRVYQFGGTYEGMSPIDVVRYILSTNMLGDILPDNEKIVSIDYDKEAQKQYWGIIVPDGTPLLGLFDYIQNRYGIYSSGVGAYLNKQSWHLFQPWDILNFNKTTDRLMIFNVPQDQMALPDKTYSADGSTISIVATGNTQHIDDRDITALNQGTGYRVGAVRALELRTNSQDDDNAESTPNDYVSASNPNPHRSGISNAPVISARFKDDDKVLQSQFKRNSGSVVKVRWENSVRGILKPGMGVKFHYPVNNKVVFRYGTLIGEVFHTEVDNGSLSSDKYNTVSELTIWLAG